MESSQRVNHFDPAVFVSTEMQAAIARIRDGDTSDEAFAALTDQHIKEVERKATKATEDVFAIVERIEHKIDQDVQTKLGNTNEMLGNLNANYIALSDMFQSIGERLTGVEQAVAIHDNDIASLKRARELLFEGRDRNYDAILEVSRQLEQLTARVTKYDHLLPDNVDRDILIQRLIKMLLDDGK